MKSGRGTRCAAWCGAALAVAAACTQEDLCDEHPENQTEFESLAVSPTTVTAGSSEGVRFEATLAYLPEEQNNFRLFVGCWRATGHLPRWERTCSESLHNDGTHGDLLADDLTWSLEVANPFAEAGTYEVRFEWMNDEICDVSETYEEPITALPDE